MTKEELQQYLEKYRADARARKLSDLIAERDEFLDVNRQGQFESDAEQLRILDEVISDKKFFPVRKVELKNRMVANQAGLENIFIDNKVLVSTVLSGDQRGISILIQTDEQLFLFNAGGAVESALGGIAFSNDTLSYASEAIINEQIAELKYQRSIIKERFNKKRDNMQKLIADVAEIDEKVAVLEQKRTQSKLGLESVTDVFMSNVGDSTVSSLHKIVKANSNVHVYGDSEAITKALKGKTARKTNMAKYIEAAKAVGGDLKELQDGITIRSFVDETRGLKIHAVEVSKGVYGAVIEHVATGGKIGIVPLAEKNKSVAVKQLLTGFGELNAIYIQAPTTSVQKLANSNSRYIAYYDDKLLADDISDMVAEAYAYKYRLGARALYKIEFYGTEDNLGITNQATLLADKLNVGARELVRVSVASPARGDKNAVFVYKNLNNAAVLTEGTESLSNIGQMIRSSAIARGQEAIEVGTDVMDEAAENAILTAREEIKSVWEVLAGEDFVTIMPGEVDDIVPGEATGVTHFDMWMNDNMRKVSTEKEIHATIGKKFKFNSNPLKLKTPIKLTERDVSYLHPGHKWTDVLNETMKLGRKVGEEEDLIRILTNENNPKEAQLAFNILLDAGYIDVPEGVKGGLMSEIAARHELIRLHNDVLSARGEVELEAIRSMNSVADAYHFKDVDGVYKINMTKMANSLADADASILAMISHEQTYNRKDVHAAVIARIDAAEKRLEWYSGKVDADRRALGRIQQALGLYSGVDVVGEADLDEQMFRDVLRTKGVSELEVEKQWRRTNSARASVKAEARIKQWVTETNTGINTAVKSYKAPKAAVVRRPAAGGVAPIAVKLDWSGFVGLMRKNLLTTEELLDRTAEGTAAAYKHTVDSLGIVTTVKQHFWDIQEKTRRAAEAGALRTKIEEMVAAGDVISPDFVRFVQEYDMAIKSLEGTNFLLLSAPPVKLDYGTERAIDVMAMRASAEQLAVRGQGVFGVNVPPRFQTAMHMIDKDEARIYEMRVSETKSVVAFKEAIDSHMQLKLRVFAARMEVTKDSPEYERALGEGVRFLQGKFGLRPQYTQEDLIATLPRVSQIGILVKTVDPVLKPHMDLIFSTIISEFDKEKAKVPIVGIDRKFMVRNDVREAYSAELVSMAQKRSGLLVSLDNVMRNVESARNRIWGIQRNAPSPGQGFGSHLADANLIEQKEDTRYVYEIGRIHREMADGIDRASELRKEVLGIEYKWAKILSHNPVRYAGSVENLSNLNSLLHVPGYLASDMDIMYTNMNQAVLEKARILRSYHVVREIMENARLKGHIEPEDYKIVVNELNRSISLNDQRLFKEGMLPQVEEMLTISEPTLRRQHMFAHANTIYNGFSYRMNVLNGRLDGAKGAIDRVVSSVASVSEFPVDVIERERFSHDIERVSKRGILMTIESNDPMQVLSKYTLPPAWNLGSGETGPAIHMDLIRKYGFGYTKNDVRSAFMFPVRNDVGELVYKINVSYNTTIAQAEKMLVEAQVTAFRENVNKLTVEIPTTVFNGVLVDKEKYPLLAAYLTRIKTDMQTAFGGGIIMPQGIEGAGVGQFGILKLDGKDILRRFPTVVVSWDVNEYAKVFGKEPETKVMVGGSGELVEGAAVSMPATLQQDVYEFMGPAINKATRGKPEQYGMYVAEMQAGVKNADGEIIEKALRTVSNEQASALDEIIRRGDDVFYASNKSKALRGTRNVAAPRIPMIIYIDKEDNIRTSLLQTDAYTQFALKYGDGILPTDAKYAVILNQAADGAYTLGSKRGVLPEHLSHDAITHEALMHINSMTTGFQEMSFSNAQIGEAKARLDMEKRLTKGIVHRWTARDPKSGLLIDSKRTVDPKLLDVLQEEENVLLTTFIKTMKEAAKLFGDERDEAEKVTINNLEEGTAKLYKWYIDTYPEFAAVANIKNEYLGVIGKDIYSTGVTQIENGVITKFNMMMGAGGVTLRFDGVPRPEFTAELLGAEIRRLSEQQNSEPKFARAIQETIATLRANRVAATNIDKEITIMPGSMPAFNKILYINAFERVSRKLDAVSAVEDLSESEELVIKQLQHLSSRARAGVITGEKIAGWERFINGSLREFALIGVHAPQLMREREKLIGRVDLTPRQASRLQELDDMLEWHKTGMALREGAAMQMVRLSRTTVENEDAIVSNAVMNGVHAANARAKFKPEFRAIADMLPKSQDVVDSVLGIDRDYIGMFEELEDMREIAGRKRLERDNIAMQRRQRLTKYVNEDIKKYQNIVDAREHVFGAYENEFWQGTVRKSGRTAIINANNVLEHLGNSKVYKPEQLLEAKEVLAEAIEIVVRDGDISEANKYQEVLGIIDAKNAENLLQQNTRYHIHEIGAEVEFAKKEMEHLRMAMLMGEDAESAIKFGRLEEQLSSQLALEHVRINVLSSKIDTLPHIVKSTYGRYAALGLKPAAKLKWIDDEVMSQQRILTDPLKTLEDRNAAEASIARLMKERTGIEQFLKDNDVDIQVLRKQIEKQAQEYGYKDRLGVPYLEGQVKQYMARAGTIRAQIDAAKIAEIPITKEQVDMVYKLERTAKMFEDSMRSRPLLYKQLDSMYLEEQAVRAEKLQHTVIAPEVRQIGVWAPKYAALVNKLTELQTGIKQIENVLEANDRLWFFKRLFKDVEDVRKMYSKIIGMAIGDPSVYTHEIRQHRIDLGLTRAVNKMAQNRMLTLMGFLDEHFMQQGGLGFGQHPGAEDKYVFKGIKYRKDWGEIVQRLMKPGQKRGTSNVDIIKELSNFGNFYVDLFDEQMVRELFAEMDQKKLGGARLTQDIAGEAGLPKVERLLTAPYKREESERVTELTKVYRDALRRALLRHLQGEGVHDITAAEADTLVDRTLDMMVGFQKSFDEMAMSRAKLARALDRGMDIETAMRQFKATQAQEYDLARQIFSVSGEIVGPGMGKIGAKARIGKLEEEAEKLKDIVIQKVKNAGLGFNFDDDQILDAVVVNWEKVAAYSGIPSEAEYEAAIRGKVVAARQTYKDELWVKWADGWLSGADRSEASALDMLEKLPKMGAGKDVIEATRAAVDPAYTVLEWRGAYNAKIGEIQEQYAVYNAAKVEFAQVKRRRVMLEELITGRTTMNKTITDEFYQVDLIDVEEFYGKLVRDGRVLGAVTEDTFALFARNLSGPNRSFNIKRMANNNLQPNALRFERRIYEGVLGQIFTETGLQNSITAKETSDMAGRLSVIMRSKFGVLIDEMYRVPGVEKGGEIYTKTVQLVTNNDIFMQQLAKALRTFNIKADGVAADISRVLTRFMEHRFKGIETVEPLIKDLQAGIKSVAKQWMRGEIHLPYIDAEFALSDVDRTRARELVSHSIRGQISVKERTELDKLLALWGEAKLGVIPGMAPGTVEPEAIYRFMLLKDGRIALERSLYAFSGNEKLKGQKVPSPLHTDWIEQHLTDRIARQVAAKQIGENIWAASTEAKFERKIIRVSGSVRTEQIYKQLVQAEREAQILATLPEAQTDTVMAMMLELMLTRGKAKIKVNRGEIQALGFEGIIKKYAEELKYININPHDMYAALDSTPNMKRAMEILGVAKIEKLDELFATAEFGWYKGQLETFVAIKKKIAAASEELLAYNMEIRQMIKTNDAVPIGANFKELGLFIVKQLLDPKGIGWGASYRMLEATTIESTKLGERIGSLEREIKAIKKASEDAVRGVQYVLDSKIGKYVEVSKMSKADIGVNIRTVIKELADSNIVLNTGVHPDMARIPDVRDQMLYKMGWVDKFDAEMEINKKRIAIGIIDKSNAIRGMGAEEVAQDIRLVTELDVTPDTLSTMILDRYVDMQRARLDVERDEDVIRAIKKSLDSVEAEGGIYTQVVEREKLGAELMALHNIEKSKNVSEMRNIKGMLEDLIAPGMVTVLADNQYTLHVSKIEEKMFTLEETLKITREDLKGINARAVLMRPVMKLQKPDDTLLATYEALSAVSTTLNDRLKSEEVRIRALARPFKIRLSAKDAPVTDEALAQFFKANVEYRDGLSELAALINKADLTQAPTSTYAVKMEELVKKLDSIAEMHNSATKINSGFVNMGEIHSVDMYIEEVLDVWWKKNSELLPKELRNKINEKIVPMSTKIADEYELELMRANVVYDAAVSRVRSSEDMLGASLEEILARKEIITAKKAVEDAEANVARSQLRAWYRANAVFATIDDWIMEATKAGKGDSVQIRNIATTFRDNLDSNSLAVKDMRNRIITSFSELVKEGLLQKDVDEFMRMFDNPSAHADQAVVDAFVGLDKWIGSRVKLFPDVNVIKESMLQSRMSSRSYIEILQTAVGVLSDQSIPEGNELVKIASKNYAERPWQRHVALAYMQPLLQYADFPEQNNILVRDFARNYDEVYKSLYENIGAYIKARTNMLTSGVREYSNAELQALVDRVGKLEKIQWAHDITADEIKTHGTVFTYLDTHRWNGVSIKRRNFLFEQGKEQGYITSHDVDIWKKVQKIIGKPVGLDTAEGKELSDLNGVLKRQFKLATLRLAVVRDFADIKAMRVSGAVSQYVVDVNGRDQLRNMLTLNEELRASLKPYLQAIRDPKIDPKTKTIAKDALETIYTYKSQNGTVFLRSGKLVDALANSFGPRELSAMQDVVTGAITFSGDSFVASASLMNPTTERLEVVDRVLVNIDGQLAKTKSKVFAPLNVEFNIKASEITFAKAFAEWEKGKAPVSRTAFMERLEELRKPLAADGTGVIKMRDLIFNTVHGVNPAMNAEDMARYHRDMISIMASGLRPEQREVFIEAASVYSQYFANAVQVAGYIERYKALDVLWKKTADPVMIERVKSLGVWEHGFEEFSGPLGKMVMATMKGHARMQELFGGVQEFLGGTISIGDIIGRDIHADANGALSKFIRQAVRIGRDAGDLGNAAAVLKATYRRAIYGASYTAKNVVGQHVARMFGGQALSTFTGLSNMINHLSYYSYSLGGHTTDKHMRVFADSVADIMPWDPDGAGAANFTKYVVRANTSWAESKYGARGNKLVVDLIKSLDKSADDMSRMIAQGVSPQTAAAKGYRQVGAAFRNLKQGEESLLGDAGYDGANTALSNSYADNVQFISKLEYVAINDSRTCKYCRSSDGTLYNVSDPKPSLPRHSNCRCTYRAWFRSPDEIVPGTDITEKTKPVRLKRWLNISDGDLGGLGESLNKLKPPKPSGTLSDGDWLDWFDEQKYSVREGMVGKDHTLAHALGLFDDEDKFDKSRALSATAKEILLSAYSDTVKYSGMELARNFVSHHEVAPKLAMAVASIATGKGPKDAMYQLRGIPFKRLLLDPEGIVHTSMVGGFNKMLGNTSGPGGALFSLATKYVPEGAMKAAIEVGASIWNDINRFLPAHIANRLTTKEKESLAGSVSKIMNKETPYGDLARSYAELLGAGDLAGRARHENILPNWFKSMEELGNAAFMLGSEIYRKPGAEWEALQAQMDDAILMYPADEMMASIARKISTSKALGSYEAGTPGQISVEQLDTFKDALKPLYNREVGGGVLDSKMLSEAKGWFTSEKIWESEELQNRVMALTVEQRAQLRALVGPKNQGRFDLLMQGGKIETNLSRFRIKYVSPQGDIYGYNDLPVYGAKEVWAGPDGHMYTGNIEDVVGAMRKTDTGINEDSFIKLIIRYMPAPDGTRTLSIMRAEAQQIRGAQNMMEVYDVKTLQQALERVFGELQLRVSDEKIPGTIVKTGKKALKTNAVATALLGQAGNFVDVLAGTAKTNKGSIIDGKFNELVMMAIEGIQKNIIGTGEVVDVGRTHEVWNLVRKYVSQVENQAGREALIRQLGDKRPTSDSLVRIREIIAYTSGV